MIETTESSAIQFTAPEQLTDADISMCVTAVAEMVSYWERLCPRPTAREQVRGWAQLLAKLEMM